MASILVTNLNKDKCVAEDTMQKSGYTHKERQEITL